MQIEATDLKRVILPSRFHALREKASVARHRKDCLEFSVTDTGIGIPLNRQALLFKRFSQTDKAIAKEYGGTGLGLSIVHSLAELMDGEVGVDSEAGKGSRFWFRIKASLYDKANDSQPVKANDITHRPLKKLYKLTGKALVVDDAPMNQQVMKALLTKLGVRAAFVENGQKAVDAILQGMQVDLVLMDVRMPVMDGFQATQRIRQWEDQTHRTHLPVIALTAGTVEEDRHKCIASGMDDFLIKPVDFNTLALMLEKWLC